MIIDSINLDDYVECRDCGFVFKYESSYRTRKLFCNECLEKRRNESIKKSSEKRKKDRDKAKESIKDKLNKIPNRVNKYFYSNQFLQKLTGVSEQRIRNNFTKIENKIYKNCYIESENGYISNPNMCFYDIREIINRLSKKIKAKNIAQKLRLEYKNSKSILEKELLMLEKEN